jgi:hypothetical protein
MLASELPAALLKCVIIGFIVRAIAHYWKHRSYTRWSLAAMSAAIIIPGLSLPVLAILALTSKRTKDA